MDLAVPIFSDEKVFDVVDIKKPKAGIITIAYEAAQKGNIFKSLFEFVAGSVESLTSVEGEIVDNPIKIKKLCGEMPYISAEVIALKAMTLINKDDVVEGVYSCPRCQTKIIAEYDKELGVDNRDRISELNVKCMEKSAYNNSIPVALEEPVKLKNTRSGEIIETIDGFEIRYPTMNDCIISGHNMQEGQEVRIQKKIYINALISVNGKAIDRKWTATWGKLLFDNVYPDELSQIGDALQKYGLDKMVERSCYKCGKVWEAPINTSNFFASGLLP